MLPFTDAVSVLVVPKVHMWVVGVAPSVQPRACCLETGVASRRVSWASLSETAADGFMVPLVLLAASRSILTLSVSCPALSASVVISLPPSLALAVFVTKLWMPHSQTPSVVLDTFLCFEAGLSGAGTVALMEPSAPLPVSGASAQAVAGVCLPFAEAVILLVPEVEATLSHSVPCPSRVWMVPGVHLLDAGDPVPKDAVTSSPAAEVAVGMVLEGSV